MMISHLLIALALQAVVAGLCRSWLAGAAAAIAWSVSREIAQAEYRWIEQFGSGLRANMPWWGGLDPRVWSSIDPWLDCALPTAVVTTVALVASRLAKSRNLT